MSFYDADDFEEEFLDVDDDEEANAYEIVMTAVFEGFGSDAESALASAKALAEEAIFDGEWELDDGKLVGEPDGTGRMAFEFTAASIIEADSIEEAIDIAASELSDEWDMSDDPRPIYLDE